MVADLCAIIYILYIYSSGKIGCELHKFLFMWCLQKFISYIKRILLYWIYFVLCP